MKTVQSRIHAICLCICLLSLPAIAAEIITEEDITQEVIRVDQLVRLTDNAIFMLDTSSSMNDEYQDTGQSKLALLASELKKRNAYLPDLGYNFGFYVYTPWQTLFELQPFDREGVANALASLPAEGSGPTRLSRGLDELRPILRPLSGRTVIFLFTDGQYTGKRRPVDIANQLAREYGVCFYVISTADDEKNRAITERVAAINECSRVIPFSNFINRPEYTSGALFEVKATEVVVTRTNAKITDVVLDPLYFGFDSTELNEASRSELDEIGEFLGKNPGSYVLINGYTDNTGPEEYNLSLSRRRTESAAAYLTETHGIEEDRIVRYWYGPLNPVADNDTIEGRIKNRRLEMAIGGL